MELKRSHHSTHTSKQSKPPVEIDEYGNEIDNSQQVAKPTNTSVALHQPTDGIMILPTTDRHNKLVRYKIEEKRLFIVDSRLEDHQPYSFEVDRGDGERIKILYSQGKDTFYQLQESVNEGSVFVGKAIMKESRLYLITEIDPMFFLLRSLRLGVAQGQRMYQTLSQILESSLGSSSYSDSMLAFPMDSMHQPGTQHQLREVLLGSERVKRSLGKICIIKEISAGSDGKLVTYCFDEAKLIGQLVQKHLKIMAHLAANYYQSTVQKTAQQRPQMIKQEGKQGGVKNEQEEEKVPQTSQSRVYENMFHTVAAGMVADELPKDLIPRFLEAVQECESSVFIGVAVPQQQLMSPQKESIETESKKRAEDEQVTQQAPVIEKFQNPECCV